MLEPDNLRAPRDADLDICSLLPDLAGTTRVADGVLVRLALGIGGLISPDFLMGAGRAKPRVRGALRPVDIVCYMNCEKGGRISRFSRKYCVQDGK